MLSFEGRFRSKTSAASPGAGSLYGLLGVGLLVVAWQALAAVFGEMAVASPAATARALLVLLPNKGTWADVAVTFKRLILGISIGSVAGLGLGLLAGLHVEIRRILGPLHWVAMTVPPAVIAIIGMLWFGMGSTQVIAMVAVVVTPLTYVNALEGFRAIDEKILEMGKTFRIPRRMLLTEIYLPGIGSAVMAGLTLTAGLGVRLVVLAELMGARSGIGHSFSRAWRALDVPELFAWVVLSLLLMAVLELCILAPIRARINRWKTGQE